MGKKKLIRHTVSVVARNKKEAIKKLRKMLLPEYRYKFVPEKVVLLKTVREYSVTWRPRKTRKSKKK